MAKAAFVLVFLVASLGKFLDEKVDACYLEAVGGGCPDVKACMETCRPCYRGIREVLTYCVAPGGGINYWRCSCEFQEGAPCPPPGPPTCPAPPSPPAVTPPTARLVVKYCTKKTGRFSSFMTKMLLKM